MKDRVLRREREREREEGEPSAGSLPSDPHDQGWASMKPGGTDQEFLGFPWEGQGSKDLAFFGLILGTLARSWFQSGATGS